MSKKVTEARILAALEKVNRFRKEVVDRDGEVMSSMGRLGMKAVIADAFGNEVPHHEYDRTSLDLAFFGVPKTVESLESLNDRWNRNINRRWDFYRRIYALQEKHQISGLGRDSYELGGREFECWGEHEQLRLIESDLDAFRSEKADIVSRWVDYSISQGLSFYIHRPSETCRDGEWHPTTANVVLAALPLYDWAKVYDQTHEKHYQATLILGSGTDRDSAETPMSEFCSCNGRPWL